MRLARIVSHRITVGRLPLDAIARKNSQRQEPSRREASERFEVSVSSAVRWL
jgi:hypothetical protein